MFSWLPAISLGNPAFLVGMAAGVIPILIHLIYRRRAPQVLFSTLRFIRLSTQRTARRRRIENLLLLIFRVLLFSLLAAALSQPFLKAGGFINPNVGVNSVIILDNSMSMSTVEQGATRYNFAKKMAREILRNMPEGSSSLLLMTNPPEGTQVTDASKLSLSSELARIYETIANSEPAAGKADIVALLMTAYSVLEKLNQPNREIYIVGDLQRISYESDWKKRERDEEAPEELGDISLIVIPCGTPDFKNAAVTSVELVTRGRVVGSTATIKAQIINSSPVELSDMPVALFIGNSKKAERTVTIPANSDTSVTFNYRLETSGAAVGLVSVDVDDSLPIDDSRGFSLKVEEKVKALIVKEKSNPVAFLDPAFYLSLALNPGEGSGIAVKEIERASLANVDLKAYDVVFLLDLSKLSEDVAAKLISYVEKGGNIVIFAGENTKPDTYPRALTPARIGDAIGNLEDRTKFYSIAWVDFEHPLMMPFKSVPFTSFSNIHVNRFVELILRRDGSGAAIAKLEGDKPFIVEGRVGYGRIIMFSTTADISWTNFPARNLYLPLMHQTVYYLTQEEGGRIEYIAGDRVTIIPHGEKQAVEVTDPLGRTRRLTPESGGGKAGVVYRDTWLTGVYKWRTVEPPVESGVFVVNPPPEESNLEPLTEKELREKFAGCRLYIAHDADEMRKVLTEVRQGVQLWNLMLMVVLGIAIVECFLANRRKPVERREEGVVRRAA